jgi:hypothetical protein
MPLQMSFLPQHPDMALEPKRRSRPLRAWLHHLSGPQARLLCAAPSRCSAPRWPSACGPRWPPCEAWCVQRFLRTIIQPPTPVHSILYIYIYIYNTTSNTCTPYTSSICAQHPTYKACPTRSKSTKSDEYDNAKKFRHLKELCSVGCHDP